MLVALSAWGLGYLEPINLFLALSSFQTIGKAPLPFCCTSFPFYYHFHCRKQATIKTRLSASAVRGTMEKAAQILLWAFLEAALAPHPVSTFHTNHAFPGEPSCSSSGHSLVLPFLCNISYKKMASDLRILHWFYSFNPQNARTLHCRDITYTLQPIS